MNKNEHKSHNKQKQSPIKIEKSLSNEIYFTNWLCSNDLHKVMLRSKAIMLCCLDNNYENLQKNPQIGIFIQNAGLMLNDFVNDMDMPDVTDSCLKRMILDGYTLKICFCPEDYLSPLGEIFDDEAIFNMACYNAKEDDYIFDGQELYSISPYKKKGFFTSVRISYLINN